MDIVSLRLFVMAAERLNISAAGRALGLAPAVASARLAKLEQDLGADLLHRTTRKVSLSLQGTEFLPYAREIIAQEEAARAALGHRAAHVSGTLRFAASSTFAQLHLMPLLPKFQDTYPDLILDLRLSDSQFDLIEGSFDLALRSTPLTDSSLKGRKLSDDTRVLCAAPAYLERHGTPNTPEELAGHALIAWLHRTSRDLINRDGRTFTVDLKDMTCTVMIDDGTSQREATIAGAGVSFNSLWSVSHEIRAGRLVRILPDWKLNDQSGLWLVYPRSNVLTPKTRVLIDFLIDNFARVPEWSD